MQVYILKNLSAGKYYIGHTNDLERRLAEHNDVSRTGWTNKYIPWQVIYSFAFNSRTDAMKEEKRLKSFKNRTTLENYIEKCKLQRAG